MLYEVITGCQPCDSGPLFRGNQPHPVSGRQYRRRALAGFPGAGPDGSGFSRGGAAKAQQATGVGRITSYNVCYTKLLRDRTFEGHIGFISPTAEFTPQPVETEDLRTKLVYEIRVLVADPDNRLRLGMPVTVRVAAASAASGMKDH